MKKKQANRQRTVFIRVAPRQRHNVNSKASRAGARFFVPKGHDGICDLCGYQTAKVQAVVRRWTKACGEQGIEKAGAEQHIKDLFPKIALAAIDNIPARQDLTPLEKDLDAAIRNTLAEDSLARWLLSCNLSVMTDERFDSWKEIQSQMEIRSGKTFEITAIRKAAERLGLTMRPADAASFIKSRQQVFSPE